jgi:NAD(P)-dependent dehydrogenase (short-subunit alcohol dehydrogenase family)
MTALGYDGKVAIITGAGGGLGRQHALLMAKRGALIVVNDLGGSVDGTGANASAAQKVVDEIKAAGGEAVADHNSVATPEGGEAIVQTAIDTFGRVDIVINNAGILRDKAFHNMEPDLLNPVLDVHLKGAFYVTKPAFVRMREQGYGRIVSTSSAAGVFGNFGQTNYGAAKMGLVGFTRVLGVEGQCHRSPRHDPHDREHPRWLEGQVGSGPRVAVGRFLVARGLPRHGPVVLGGRWPSGAGVPR